MLGVRRKEAAATLAYTRGAVAEATRALATPARRKAALMDLERGLRAEYGATGIASRLRTVDALAAAADLAGHSVTLTLVLAVSDGLKAGGFRPGWGTYQLCGAG